MTYELSRVQSSTHTYTTRVYTANRSYLIISYTNYSCHTSHLCCTPCSITNLVQTDKHFRQSSVLASVRETTMLPNLCLAQAFLDPPLSSNLCLGTFCHAISHVLLAIRIESSRIPSYRVATLRPMFACSRRFVSLSR